MRLIITFLMAWCLSWGAYAATAPDSKQITQELEQAKAAKPAQPEVVEALQSALNALEERKGSLERIKQYQQVIDNYPKLSATLRAQLNNMRDEPRSVSPGMSTDALNQEILQVSSQLLDKSRQAQQEQERAREIADSMEENISMRKWVCVEADKARVVSFDDKLLYVMADSELVDADLVADAAAKAFGATFDVDDSLVNEDESELPPELLTAPAVAD